MTVEERAKLGTKAIIAVHVPEDDYLSDGDIELIITQLLRDQIEDCAKVADGLAQDFIDWNWPDKQRYAPSMVEIAQSVAVNIRALAGQIDQPERKKVER